MRCIKFVSNYFRDYSASRISDYSHRAQAYIKTRHQEVIDYHFAGALSIPVF